MGVKKFIEKIYDKPFNELLYDLYIKEDMSMQEVAEKLGIGVATVHKWLCEYGITKHKNLWE